MSITTHDHDEGITPLPLWRNALEELEGNGELAYGKAIPTSFFEGHFKAQQDTMAFGLELSELRRALETKGFWLDGRKQHSRQYIIRAAADNHIQMHRYQRAAMDAMKRAVTLGANTDTTGLTAGETRRHESALEKIQLRLALCSRRTPQLRQELKALTA
jgi:hypothetical protein